MTKNWIEISEPEFDELALQNNVEKVDQPDGWLIVNVLDDEDFRLAIGMYHADKGREFRAYLDPVKDRFTTDGDLLGLLYKSGATTHV